MKVQKSDYNLNRNLKMQGENEWDKGREIFGSRAAHNDRDMKIIESNQKTS